MMIVAVLSLSAGAFAQTKIDEARMQRDVQIAENVLSTLIKQQLGKRSFFPMEVEASYLPGYGVTFRIPSEFFGAFILKGDGVFETFSDAEAPGAISFSYDNGDNHRVTETKTVQRPRAPRAPGKGSRNKVSSADSAQTAYNQRILAAAKDFIADYGDLLSQVQPNEKIIVTNRADGRNNFALVWSGNGSFDNRKQHVISVEGTKSDVAQFRQGKLSREQLLAKFKVVDSEINDELQPDLELLSSIFNRLYSRDLSKTYFSDQNIYYERLKDYGVIYHMQVFASSQDDEGFFEMPTVGLNDLDQQARNKKVKELYPEFERTIKDDFLEYGKTVKSLKDEEVLTMEIHLTRCEGCAIPVSIELSVKNSVLKEYAAGKISKEAALAKVNIKKGAEQ